ncbi:MAG: SOS response-associated peptidase [Wenzhouxiangellaceae bacterium]
MCGRYTLIAEIDYLIEMFQLPPETTLEHDAPRYNQAPSDAQPGRPPVERRAPVVRRMDKQNRLDELIWRLIPRWSKGQFVRYNTINAKSETVAEKGMFKAPWSQSMRCLIPASGIIEWQTLPVGPKQPYHITLDDRECFAMGGVWEASTTASGNTVYSFAILTTAANDTFSDIHPRMPVIIAPDDYQRWLQTDPDDAATLCQPYTAQSMVASAISRGVNNPHANDARLLEPDTEPPQEQPPPTDPQETLF